MARSPFPLQWPDGWARTKYTRRDSSFDKKRGFNAARDGALHELRLMSARHVVITSNLPTNTKGLPHSSSSGQLSDPGIAIWWVDGKGSERVMACDRFYTAVENMHSIELTLAAVRGMARWGSTELIERSFAGFAALPPGSANGTHEPPQPMKRLWRELLCDPWGNGVSSTWPIGLSKREELAIAKDRHRVLMKMAHPDAGGTHERAAEINAALAEAEKELA